MNPAKARPMHGALPMLPMLPSDRAILRNLVLVVITGSGAAALLGMSCLNRGITGLDSASVTNLTSFDRPAPTRAPQMNPQIAPPTVRQGPPEPSFDPRDPNGMATPNGPPPAPMRTGTLPPVPNSGGPNGTRALAPPSTIPYPPTQTIPSGAPAPPSPLPPQTPGHFDGGGTSQRMDPPPPPPPRFATEAPPWAASNYSSNPEAGAGQFITDTPQPPR